MIHNMNWILPECSACNAQNINEFSYCYMCEECQTCLTKKYEIVNICPECSGCDRCTDRCEQCNTCIDCNDSCASCHLCSHCCSLDWNKITSPFEGYDYVLISPTIWQRAISRKIGCYDPDKGIYGMRYDRTYNWQKRFELPVCAAYGDDYKYIMCKEFINALPVPDKYVPFLESLLGV